MQTYKKTCPVRFNRPNPATTLASGQPTPNPLPVEFRLAALLDPRSAQFNVVVTINLPTEVDYCWLATGITFGPGEGSVQGIDPVLNPDSWCALERLKSRLFELFAISIATGAALQRSHVETSIRAEGMTHCTWVLTYWVDRIRQLQDSHQITFEQARDRLFGLAQLIDAIDTPFVLFNA